MSCTPEHVTEPAPEVRLGLDDARRRLERFVATMSTRRSIRDFSTDPVPDDLVEQAVLAPLGTDATKPFLTDAPHLLVVMEVHASDTEPKPYYAKESVGIALGFLLCALHHAGLAALTHTPSPMGVLTEVLERPPNERPYVVLPIGWPAATAEVPRITRKPLDEVLVRV